LTKTPQPLCRVGKVSLREVFSKISISLEKIEGQMMYTFWSVFGLRPFARKRVTGLVTMDPQMYWTATGSG